MLELIWVDDLDPSPADQVRNLLLAARDEDGWPSITPGGPLPPEFGGGAHLLGFAGETLAGYGHLDTRGDAFGRQVAELIVAPAERGRGYGTRLADALLERSEGTLRAWSHGAHPAAAALAKRLEFTPVRELLRMAAPLPATPLDMPALPEGITLRSFTPGADEQAVVDVNARAFSWHPEQGAMTVDDLRAAERQSWFDPAGFLLATDPGGRLLGFHWTKVHPAEPGGEPTGEVYVVGVDPAAQGGGLGRGLTAAGLEYLRSRGLRRVILYVEGDNPAAIAVYSGLGFATDTTAIQYERPGSSSTERAQGITL